eukprot:COSAG01_NODE_8916_length_2615_cov_1.653418_4_plen_133_part_00
MWPSAQAVAEGKALWEEVDTDGADSGEGLGIEDFCTTFCKFILLSVAAPGCHVCCDTSVACADKFQRAGLLDTAWEALEKKAKGTTRIRRVELFRSVLLRMCKGHAEAAFVWPDCLCAQSLARNGERVHLRA